jgi:hypothetical protein
MAKKGAICLIFDGDMPPKNITPKYNGELLTRKIQVEVGSSIPYLVCNSIHSSSCIGSIKEAGLTQQKVLSLLYG